MTRELKSGRNYSEPKSRKSKFTPAEISVLVKLMRKHAKYMQGRWADKKVLQKRQKVWLEIVDAVNRVSVEERTVDEVKSKWKKCRKDIQSFVKNESE